MHGFMLTLLICSVTMSALILLYMAVTPCLLKRYSVAGRYYAWLVIVIGLIIPFRPHLSRTFVRLEAADTPAAAVQAGNMVSKAGQGQTISHSFLGGISWWQIVCVIWMAGMFLYLGYHILKHYRFLKLTKRWSRTVTNQPVKMLLGSMTDRMGISRSIGLQVCDIIGSPMLTGFSRPRILLPDADYTEAELRFILKHELTHYTRKDLWYKALVLAAAAIHWFNPIVHLAAREIGRQCELSCDEAVVKGEEADSRQYYVETIISVIRGHSKLRTVFSTNFNGGMKGMKERIVSIMDTRQKKAGPVILCAAVILTMSLGFVFTVNAENKDSSVRIKEDIKIAADIQFLPDPAIYAAYSAYGITISEDGSKLLYNGKKVRLFVDEYSDTGAFYSDDTGTLDLSVIRDSAGRITGIDRISEKEAGQYRYAFFEDESGTPATVSGTSASGKYDQYTPYGVTSSSDGQMLYYNGQHVRLLADKLTNDAFETLWLDEAGTANLSVTRNSDGRISGIERISKEKADQYLTEADAYTEKSIDGLEEKIAAKLNGYN